MDFSLTLTVNFCGNLGNSLTGKEDIQDKIWQARVFIWASKHQDTMCKGGWGWGWEQDCETEDKDLNFIP